MKRLVLSLFAFGLAVSASATTPGGVRKKFVALNFDVLFNSPANVCAHADQLNAVPWLDGVTVSLRDVPVKTADGKKATSDSCKLMQRGHKWSREGVKGQIPHLSGIVKRPRLKESFLMTWITPTGKENRLAWTDDAGWKLLGENLAVLAWLAKSSGLKGLMLDPEEYSGAGQYCYTDAEKNLPFADCVQLARQRGREVFSRAFKEFPDGVYFFLWTFEHSVRHHTDRVVTDPRGLSDAVGDLLPHFFNGMLDVLPPTARFVDGAEHYSLTATKDMYWQDAINQLVGARAFVAPENWAKYRGQLLVGNTHYLDMYAQGADPASRWYHGPVDGSRLEHLRRNLVQSLQAADEYVWVYGETGRLIDWKRAVTKWQKDQQQLWEVKVPGLTETMMLAKDPDEFLELRRAECAARGELKNLAEGFAGLPAKYSSAGGRQTLVSRVTRSVKGVRAGDVYEVGQEVRFEMSEGHPDLKVSWRAKGKAVAARSNPTFAFKPAEKPKAPSWLRGKVAVPEGADEMVLSFAADLKPGETATAGRTEVFWAGLAPKSSKALSLESDDDQEDGPKPDARKGAARSKTRSNLIAKDAKPFDQLKAERVWSVVLDPRPSVKVRPGELYGVGLSCRMTAYAGSCYFLVKWLKDGRQLAWDTKRPFVMNGPRENGVWRSGSVLVRVPAEADELVLEAGAKVNAGETFEFDKPEIYRLGEPLPDWPAESLREKEYKL